MELCHPMSLSGIKSFKHLSLLVLWSCDRDGRYGHLPMCLWAMCAFVLRVESIHCLLFRSHFWRASPRVSGCFCSDLVKERAEAWERGGHSPWPGLSGPWIWKRARACFSFSGSANTSLLTRSQRGYCLISFIRKLTKCLALIFSTPLSQLENTTRCKETLTH